MHFKYDRLEISLARDIERNPIQIKGIDYGLEELYPGARSGKGGNSSVFLASPIFEVGVSYVVKFCRYPVKPENANYTKRIKRFKHEVAALVRAKDSDYSDCVIGIEAAGNLTLKSKGREGVSEVTLAYYVMERADVDLTRYLEEEELDDDAKKSMIQKFSRALMGLHSLGIRHRDLKPDNVFFVGDLLKLGDLGLVDDRSRDYSIDDKKEKIGPMGFLSPEALNKAFGDNRRMPDVGQCEICEKSDIYQLGLIFFYILQGEVPAGCIEPSDFDHPWRGVDSVRDSITSMLQFRKSRRITLLELVDKLSK